jgi:hypothetical protein
LQNNSYRSAADLKILEEFISKMDFILQQKQQEAKVKMEMRLKPKEASKVMTVE